MKVIESGQGNGRKRYSSLFKLLLQEDRISARFRYINITLFAAAIFLMTLVMLFVFNSIIRQFSAINAERYAASSAESLASHIAKEISLMSVASRAESVVDWLNDEDNEEKKNRALNDLSIIVGELYSKNMYIGAMKSFNEYIVYNDFRTDGVMKSTTLDVNSPEDAWFFNSVESDESYSKKYAKDNSAKDNSAKDNSNGYSNDYSLNVGVDKLLNKKCVWINYRIMDKGVPIGAICTGLDFNQLAGELLEHHDSENFRSFIIDENGLINMDSSLLGYNEFLIYNNETYIENVFSDPTLINAIRERLVSADGYLDSVSSPSVTKLSNSSYGYMTIAPIQQTNWLVIILFDSSSFLDMLTFLPLIVVLLFLLIMFALATNATTYRLIFRPLELLVRSLAQLKEYNEAEIYGADRNDEFGTLSKTIQDFFTKANYDVLTGIYNRRFMENNLNNIMRMLSRSNGVLSVLMIDVDYFKNYNDTYGHEQGDICLKKIARAVSVAVTRANDFVARYGGEEFVAILPNTDKLGACMIADKLLASVRNLNLPHTNSAVAEHVTISIGVATGKVTHSRNWEDYLERADEALYTSKQNGRNTRTYLEALDKSL